MTVRGRILIATWDGGGNTPSAFNLGARLVRQGHAVRLVGWESMAARAAVAGVEFTTYSSVPPWPAGLTLEDGWEDRVLPALLGPATKDDIVSEARDFVPDIVVVDCMLGAGFDAAPTLGLPTAVLVHILYSSFMYEWGDQATHSERARLLGESDVVFALVPPGFDAPCPVPATRPTSVRSLPYDPGRHSIQATPSCWPSLVTHGC